MSRWTRSRRDDRNHEDGDAGTTWKWTAVLTVVLALGVAPALAQMPDHLKCYKIVDALNLTGTADLATPQFGPDPGCRISKAQLFCVPATTANVAVVDKTTGAPIVAQPMTGSDPGERICYKIKCPTAQIPDHAATDPFGSRPVRKFRAALLCTPAGSGGAPTTSSTSTPTTSTTTTTLRFVDNGDGTVTDNSTGLQWEKKDTICPGIHCVTDFLYTWNTTSGGTTPNGTVFTNFLGTLNSCVSSSGTTVTGGFAGHCDWRLPTVAELQSILLTPFPCGTSPCIDPVFGPTAPALYWSSTTIAHFTSGTWDVNFGNGFVDDDGKDGVNFVRAVRGGW